MKAKEKAKFRKPPYFKFNVGDFLSSLAVQRMNSEQRGWYLMLLARSWDSTRCCYLVNDPDAIEMAVGIRIMLDGSLEPEELARFRSTGQIVLNQFDTTEDGRFIYNDRLLSEYEELSGFRSKLSRTIKNGLARKRKQEKDLHANSRVTLENSTVTLESQTETETETRDHSQRQEKSVSSAPENPSGAEPVAGTLSLIDGTKYQVAKQEIDQWQALYPAIDVTQQFRSMQGWLLANPKNRKTRSGIKRFINSWLAREQNSARATNTPQVNPAAAVGYNGNADEWELLTEEEKDVWRATAARYHVRQGIPVPEHLQKYLPKQGVQ